MKVTLLIKLDQETPIIELTMEQARELYNELGKLVDLVKPPIFRQYIPDMVTTPLECRPLKTGDQPFYDPVIVTCEVSK